MISSKISLIRYQGINKNRSWNWSNKALQTLFQRLKLTLWRFLRTICSLISSPVVSLIFQYTTIFILVVFSLKLWSSYWINKALVQHHNYKSIIHGRKIWQIPCGQKSLRLFNSMKFHLLIFCFKIHYISHK